MIGEENQARHQPLANQQAQEPLSGPGQRRVRFCGLVAVMGRRLKPASEMTPEEKEAVWWQKGDLKSFERHARMLSTESRKRGPNTQSSYKHTLIKSYEECETLTVVNGEEGPSQHQQNMLNQWIRVSPARRGLERFCTERLYSALKVRRTASIRSIVSAQRDLPARLTPDEKADYLRSVYLKLTIPTRAFARALGKADEDAVTSPRPTPPLLAASTIQTAERSHDPVLLFTKARQRRHAGMSIPGPFGIVRRLSAQRC